MKIFSIIAAIDSNHGIGKEGRIPWHYPQDFKHFKLTTDGGTCFMGRKTYNEIAGMRVNKKDLLPNRNSVVLTTTPLKDKRVTVCSDLTKYLDHATERNFFIGGSGIFNFALDIADELILTAIPGTYDCDVIFPMDRAKDKFEL